MSTLKAKDKTIRIIVAGGRDFDDYETLEESLDDFLKDKDKDKVEIICGEARGADRLGKLYAIENDIECKSFWPDWEKHKKMAGIVRNQEMKEYAGRRSCEGHLFAFWDEKSKGTKHMLTIAKRSRIKTHLHRY